MGFAHREKRDQNTAEHSRCVTTNVVFKGFFVVWQTNYKNDTFKLKESQAHMDTHTPSHFLMNSTIYMFCKYKKINTQK